MEVLNVLILGAAGLIAFAITILGIPMVIKAVYAFGWLDEPNHRSAHANARPTMGGIAIMAGVALSSIPALWLGEATILPAILASTGLLLLVGMRDDVAGMSAKFKLLLQTAAAVVVVAFGLCLPEALFGAWSVWLPQWCIQAVSVLVIVAAVNAVNLVDGVDGLAGGLVLMAALVLLSLFVASGQLMMSILAIAVVGAVAGFLKFNFHPARIFMGDSGSMTLGFLLACMGIYALNSVPVALPSLEVEGTLFLLLAAFMLPGLDMIRTMLVRLLAGRSPFEADKNHLHHLLLGAGLNHGAVSVWAYGMTLCNLLLAVCLVWMDAALWFAIPVQLLAGLLIMRARPTTIAVPTQTMAPST